MADTIKIGSLDISAFKVGSSDCKVYLGDTLLYPLREPSFKWKATYSDSSVASAECDASSAITQNEINLSNLISAEIGDCVTEIGDRAIYYCTTMLSITIPDSVASIGGSAFFYNTSLTSVVIGSGVTSIGAGAFFGCSSLASITINAVNPPSIGNSPFSNTNNCPLLVPASSVDAYKATWTSLASRIQAIPNS